MKPDSTIQFKALILFIIFSLNTVLGFACSMGVDMGYNSGHHSKKKKQESAHTCCEKPAADNQDSEDKDDCCSNSVIHFQLMAKTISQFNFDFAVPVALFHHEIAEIDSAPDSFNISTDLKWALSQTQHLYPPDIRVSIRSFQI